MSGEKRTLMGEHGDAVLDGLLQATVERHVSSAARVISVEAVPIGAGMSEAAVRRYRVDVSVAGRSRSITLVTKLAPLVERRVLTLLQAQGHRCVPYSHTLDLTGAAPALICLEDLGDERRPTSLDPIPDAFFAREADAVAGIHAANFDREDDLPWLPRVDRAYFVNALEQQFWRPAWERALADDGFVDMFRPWIAIVEAAAARSADEMTALAGEAEWRTLVHTDLNPSNVLVRDGRPGIIDWHAAHVGPLYLDIPHHFCTLDQAEHYRRALAGHGRQIPAADFAARYRVAARYTALRYMWWTLDAWRQAPATYTDWVLHYFGMLGSHPE